MNKIAQVIKEQWENPNYSVKERIIIIISALLITGLILFSAYCLIGWVLWFLYNSIASISNLPKFSYWFFVLGSLVIHIIVKTPTSIKEQ